MVSQLLSEIMLSVSSPRLLRYRSATGVDHETAVNHFWNLALAESLFCSLNMVDIALRNALHDTLAHHFGVPAWYDRRGLLEPNQRKDVDGVKGRIMKRGDPVTPDRIVSELTFGFSVTLLSRNYDARLWQGQHAAPLKRMFLRIPKNKRQRQLIHQQYNEIRERRNRVFHYEPIFDDPFLRQRHGEIKRGLHWLNPRMVDILELYDRFPAVHRDGRVAVEDKLRRATTGPP